MVNEGSFLWFIEKELVLEDAEKEALYDLLSKGCHQETKNRLWRKLGMISLVPRKGILNRLMVRPYVHYVAGQDYPAELRVVREVILDRGR